MLRELLRMEIAPIGSTHYNASTFFDERTAQRVQFGG